ncbi:hypothetical protein ACWGMA_19425 [Streptomyces asiaticus]
MTKTTSHHSATQHTLVRYTGKPHTLTCRPERLTVHTARACVSRGRRTAEAVHVYETTDRDGTRFHVVHVYFGSGHWTGVDFVTDIYEIPTEALTAL